METKEFTPMKNADTMEMFKNFLLKGYGLKIDGGGHDCIDVIPRNAIFDYSATQNVGCGDFNHLPRYADSFCKAINALRNEYVVVVKDCEGSGCCQYAAKIYYLA